MCRDWMEMKKGPWPLISLESRPQCTDYFFAAPNCYWRVVLLVRRWEEVTCASMLGHASVKHLATLLFHGAYGRVLSLVRTS